MAFLLEDQASLPTDLYRDSVARTARDLEVAISGLTDVMEYFSVNGNHENLPLSVSVYHLCESNSYYPSSAKYLFVNL